LQDAVVGFQVDESCLDIARVKPARQHLIVLAPRGQRLILGLQLR
jgi:hypothetical protein